VETGGSCAGSTLILRSWSVTDNCGNVTTKVQTISVNDNIAPTITCPGPVSGGTDAGQCYSTTVVLGMATASGDCSTPVITNDAPVSGQFPVGVTIVTWKATDACGNFATCTQTVTIHDNQPPVFTLGCPATTITQSALGGQCTATVSVPGPLVSDPCGELVSLTHNSPYSTNTNNADGNYPVGITTITWTATDASSNTTTCQQVVVVKDVTAPTIICPADATESATVNNCFKNLAAITNPTIFDSCTPVGSLSLTYTMTGATASSGIGTVTNKVFNVGLTTVTYTVTDLAGNSASCSFTVTIIDVTPPQYTVTCPIGSVTANTGASCTATVTLSAPTATDTCGPVTLSHNSPYGTSSTDASGNYPVGTTTITWTATDASGNVATCTQTVIVTDIQPPVFISCPTNQEELITNGGCDKTAVTITNPTFSDNCTIDRLVWTMSGATTGNSATTGINYVNGQVFNVGITTVTYTVYDAAGLSATCTFTVWMKNLNAPQFTVTCPASPAPVTVTGNACDIFVSVASPITNNPCTETYTITNNSPYKTSDLDASGTYPIGLTTVIWTIIDASGNVRNCTQTVTVNDLPLDCPDDITTPADNGKTYASGVVVPPPTYSSTCSVTLTYSMVKPDASVVNSPATGKNEVPSPGTFDIGVTTITYTLTHATGAVETCSFTITVTSKPDISCPPDLSGNTDTGTCTWLVNSGIPTLIQGAQPITWTWTITGPTGVVEATGTSMNTPIMNDYNFNPGTSTITWTATNISGSDQCEHTVTVTDNIKPTFTMPNPLSGCVENIKTAVYDPATQDILPARPDYYLFIAGNPALDISDISDNCCGTASMTIHWRIDFSGGTPTSITGTGQLSTYGSDIQFPGDTEPYDTDLVHTITYWVEDCHGNTSPTQTQNITIKPRPNIVKMP
jgi:hypothetical protein